MNLTGVGTVWLSADGSGVTGNVNNFTAFALYDSTKNPGYSALQVVGDAVPGRFGAGPSWWYMDIPSNITQEVYPPLKVIGSSQPIGILNLQPNGGGVDLWIPYSQAWLSCNAMSGLRPWLLPRNTFWTNHAWTMTTVNDWNADQTGADLRWLRFDSARILGKGLNNARFADASCSNAVFIACQLRGADFAGTMMSTTSFSGAGFDGAPPTASDLTGAKFDKTGALGASFRGCNLTNAVFNSAYLSFPVAGFAPPASFAGATLTGASFSAGTILMAVDFSNAVLRGTKLPGANLQQAKFAGADLTDADLSAADLTGADLSGATLVRTNLSGAKFDAATKFTGAAMMGANFTNCDLRQAKFSQPPQFYTGALTPPTAANPRTRLCQAKLPLSLIAMDWTWLDLTGATIDGTPPMDLTGFKARFAILPNAYDLSKRTLAGALFQYAQLPNAVLEGVVAPTKQPPDFSNADLTGARMSQSSLKGANFTEATLWKVNLSNSILDFANFKSAHLETRDQQPVDLTYCSLLNAKFGGAFLSDDNARGANLAYVTFWGSDASIDGATISFASFERAFLAGVSFKSIKDNKFAHASFTGACLVNCNFEGANLQAVSLTGACLQGAVFKNASLGGAQMNGAAVALAPGSLTITGNDTLPPAIKYLTPTDVTSDATNGDTHCPNGASGPCAGDKWSSTAAPMQTWAAPPKPRVRSSVE